MTNHLPADVALVFGLGVIAGLAAAYGWFSALHNGVDVNIADILNGFTEDEIVYSDSLVVEVNWRNGHVSGSWQPVDDEAVLRAVESLNLATNA